MHEARNRKRDRAIAEPGRVAYLSDEGRAEPRRALGKDAMQIVPAIRAETAGQVIPILIRDQPIPFLRLRHIVQIVKTAFLAFPFREWIFL